MTHFSSCTLQKQCDILISGSTLFAIDTAIEAAAQGKHVVLAAERTNPFIECIGSLRAYVPTTVDRSLSPTLDAILSMQDNTVQLNNRLYFNPHQAALLIEDRLCESGVELYYNAMPVSALLRDESVQGAVFGGKPGLFAIEAGLMIDCTLNSTIARSAGATTITRSAPAQIAYSFELKEERPEQCINFEEEGLSGQLSVHRFYADFKMTLSESATGPLAQSEDFVRAYEKAINILEKNGLPKFRGADTFFHSGHSTVQNNNGSLTGIENLFVMGPLALDNNKSGQLVMEDPLILHRNFSEIGSTTKAVDDRFRSKPEDQEKYIYSINPKPLSLNSDLEIGNSDTECQISFSDPTYCAPASSRIKLRLSEDIPSLQTEVLIAGCGTSGVGAAYQAAKIGLNPLCIDNALEMGGTNTVGGVTNLWFGNPTRAFKDFYKACGAENDKLNASPFFKAMKQSGATLFPFTPVCGTAYEDRRLKSVFVITPEGLLRIDTRQSIDATGDGSLAAWSGAEYTYGSERDGLSSWASFGNFSFAKPEAARQFLSPVDERCPKDTTRFIIAMRRSLKHRFEGQAHVHPAFYVAPRTTRHIKGNTTVTYLDMLAGRKFKDGILRARSNIDTKGTETSNAFKVGFYPYQRLAKFEVTIPYSSLIPVGFDNIIIVGKAYSITNDALTMARMQRDLFVLGMVAAEAVLLCNKSHSGLGEIAIDSLQNRLFKLGALAPEDIANDDYGFIQSTEELIKPLLSDTDDKNALCCSAQLLLLGKDEVLPLIEDKRTSLSTAMGRLLCFWKNHEGVEYIRTQLGKQLEGNVLPLEINAEDHKAHQLPDHGFAPLSILHLNNLALAGDSSAVEFIIKIASQFTQTVDDHATRWSYAFGLAYATERMACKSLIAPIVQVLNHPVFEPQFLKASDDLRKAVKTELERLAYLRLCLSRALARCGSDKGVENLIDFLDDARASYAVNAKDELCVITGKDFAYDQVSWIQWLQNNKGCLKPTPVTISYQ